MKRVLIVDDAIELGRVLQDTLKITYPGVAVSIVPSAEEALLETGRFTIDLLVTDLRLPGMTGVELIRKMRARQADVKVILITGLAQDARLDKQVEDARPDRFLRKPIATPDFLDAVEGLIGPPQPVGRAAAPEPGMLVTDARPPSPPAAVATASTPAQPTPPTDDTPGLAELLRSLRGRLGARSAALLDERGYPVALAGAEIAELSAEAAVLAPFMAAVSAAEKVSYALSRAQPRGRAQAVQAFRGPGVDWVAAPVGLYTLLLALEPGRSALRLALAFEEALLAQADLAAALVAMGLRVETITAPAMEQAQAIDPAPIPAAAHVEAAPEAAGLQEQAQAPAAPAQEAPDPGAETLEEMLAQQHSGNLLLQDADDFWNAAAEEDSRGPDQPGVLSLEQARKLGLFPENDAKE
jgi:CheY-like chemotaxis protein